MTTSHRRPSDARATICLVKPSPGTGLETFILAHETRLPARVVVVSGLLLPQTAEGSVLSQAVLPRAWRKAGRLLRRKSWDWDVTLGFAKIISKSGASAVLAEYGPTGTHVLEACQVTGVPLIAHFHGYDASIRTVLHDYEAAYRVLFDRAAALVVVSRAMERKLVSLGAPAGKIHYNPCGVDCQFFAGAKPAVAAPIFLTVGRFVPKKAPHLTLLAFAEVHRALPTARLRMVGSGELLDVCRDLALGLGISDAVTFLGSTPPQVVRDEMRGAMAFVQHSVEAPNGDCEGTPVSVLEAGASGLPVVATRHGGIPDVVEHEETGLLVDERDVSGTAAQMLRLARDPSLASRLGAAARQRVSTHFSMDDSIGRLWHIIDRCITVSSPR